MLGFLLKFVSAMVYVSVPFYALKAMSSHWPAARFYFRLFLYLSVLSVSSVWGVIVSIVMTVMRRRFDINYVVARSFCFVGGAAMGINFIVEGEHHLKHGPGVLIGNHQSMLDILYLGRIFPRNASILAKTELQWMPFLGQYMIASGAVFVNRSNNKNAVAALAAAGEKMKSRGISLWLFPEGTRHLSKDPMMLPFKKGAFHLAVQAQVPIVPIICQNYWHLYHAGVLEPGTLRIVVLDPVPTAGLTSADVPELMSRIRDSMVARLCSISEVVTPKAAGERTQGFSPEQLTPVAPSAHHANGEGSDEDGVLVDRP